MSVVRRMKRDKSSRIARSLVRNAAKLPVTERDMALLALRPPPRGFRQEHREATFKRLRKVARTTV